MIISNVIRDVVGGVIGDVVPGALTPPPIFATALVDLNEAGIVDNGVNVIRWNNSGTGGAAYDLDTVLGFTTLVKSQVNGLFGVLGDNNGGLGKATPIAIPAPWSIFMVAMVNPGAVGNQYFHDGNPSRVTSFYSSGLGGYRFGAGVNVDIPALNEAGVLRVHGAATDTRVHVGGLADVDPAITGALDFDWGHVLTNQAATDHAQGFVGRILVFDSIVSTADFDAIMLYLRDSWGTS